LHTSTSQHTTPLQHKSVSSSSLFLYSSAARQALNFFPTRRSSDLTGSRHDGSRPSHGSGSGRRWHRRSGPAEGRSNARTPRRGRDRKSTRLNSSHVSISYAVFCLKKKKALTMFKGSTYSTESL